MLSQLGSLLAPPVCWSCRRPASRDRALCRACARELRHLASELVDVAGVPCFAPVAYEGAARDLVRALKFRGALAVARSMAAAIVATAPDGLFAGAALVPVPLAAGRARRRGFNQAAVLARDLGRRTGRPVVACLERGGPAGSQVGRDRAGRARAVAGAVHASPGARPLRRAVLVDDVVTTGATLGAAASALRRADCERVLAVAYARTLGR